MNVRRGGFIPVGEKGQKSKASRKTISMFRELGIPPKRSIDHQKGG